MFSMGYTEGPNPPKETLTFKKNFFGKQLRDHYPRALNHFGVAKNDGSVGVLLQTAVVPC